MKAQFWSFDGVFAVTIFTIAILMLAAVWVNVNKQLSLAYGFGIGSMQQQLLNLESRIASPGVPPNWNNEVIANNSTTWSGVSIGLGTGKNGTISTAKILYLSAISSNYINYQNTKYMLGSAYDYYIIINAPNLYNMTIGRNPLSRNATAIQVANLQGVLDNGAPVNLKVEVWTNTTFGVS